MVYQQDCVHNSLEERVVHGPGTPGSDLASGPSVLIRISAETGSGDTGGGWTYLSVTVTAPSFPVVQNYSYCFYAPYRKKRLAVT